MVYPGEDCKFTIYEDEGNNYNFENGAYATTELTWDDKTGTLTVGGRQGSYPGMEEMRRYLRNGMGLCQGQTCGKLVKGIMARELHVRPTDIEPAVSRAPMRPIEMKVLARDGGDCK